MLFHKYASVILDVSIHKKLDYGIPDPLLPTARPGVRVTVPVKGSLQRGYIFALKDSPEVPKVFPIHEILSETAIITEDLFQLGLWMAKYYTTPLHKVIKSIIPATVRKLTKPKEQLFVMRAKTRQELIVECKALRIQNSLHAEIIDVMLQVNKGILLTELMEKANISRSPVETLVKKGLLSIHPVRVERSPFVDEEYFKTKPKPLHPEQQNAYNEITETLHNQEFRTHLLYGVTGSGKTEIYLQVIEKALEMNKGAIVLVPEISLTTQLVERFRSRFDHRIAVMHHRLSQGERFDQWDRLRRGEAVIAIGARSAIFSPVQNLGLIIVDEEHEQSYKQSEEMPCYHARDIAVMRGKLSRSAVVLGSATPSLESYTNALQGKYLLSNLSLRADAAQIPKITIVDMRKEDGKAKRFTSFSEALLTGIDQRRKKGEQTILFLNRRGYHTTLLCEQCRFVHKCPHCDLSLTFHKSDNDLRCHICSFGISPPPKYCPTCKNPHPLKFTGIGTEQIENALHAIFPDIRTIRLDADTTRHKGSHQKLLKNFGVGKADVLIGTQMIAKGLHFPEVTLVGILNCDLGLNIPDFRASETLFQLITQVSGRAGRGSLPGEVFIQTRVPENQVIQHALKQDYHMFYQEEANVRNQFRYPPFSRLIKLVFTGSDETFTVQLAETARQQLADLLPPTIELHPVIPCGYAKIKDKYRFQFLIKGGVDLHGFHQKIESVLPQSSKVKVTIDIDPVNTFF